MNDILLIARRPGETWGCRSDRFSLQHGADAREAADKAKQQWEGVEPLTEFKVVTREEWRRHA